jgi:hypothetical protein
MRRIYWSTLSDTQAETDGNHIIIKGEVEAKSKLEVSVVDEKDSQVRRFIDVKPGEHKVLITMKFR